MPITYVPRIKNYRWDRGVSQATLANAIGLSRPALSAIEQAKSDPSLTVALRLAEYFNTSVENLFTRS